MILIKLLFQIVNFGENWQNQKGKKNDLKTNIPDLKAKHPCNDEIVYKITSKKINFVRKKDCIPQRDRIIYEGAFWFPWTCILMRFFLNFHICIWIKVLRLFWDYF